MIYFDAAYVAKCYLNEPGAERVREVARAAEGLASCELARLEFVCIVQRHLRDGHLTRREARAVFGEFEQDDRTGVWQWLAITAVLVGTACDRVKRLPPRIFLRTGDAIHLACASEYGFRELYTNDRHMLAGCRYFHLAGIDVLEAG